MSELSMIVRAVCTALMLLGLIKLYDWAGINGVICGVNIWIIATLFTIAKANE